MEFNFLKFLNISHIFTKSTVEQQKDISKKAKTFLVNNALEAYYDLIKNGYKPPNEQKKIFEYRFKDLMKEKNPLISKLIEKGYQITPRNLTDFLEIISEDIGLTIYSEEHNLNIIKLYELYSRHDNKHYISNLLYVHYSDYKHMYEEILKNYQKPDFQKAILNFFVLNSNHVISKQNVGEKLAYAYSLILPNSFSLIPQSQFLSVTKDMFESRNLKVLDAEYQIPEKYIEKSIGKVIGRISEQMQKDFTSIYSEDMKNLVEKTKTHFLSEYVTQTALAESISSINKGFENNPLPKLSTEYINTIKNDYSFIVKNSEPSQQISKLVNEELPTVISRYLGMLPENRLTMVNSQGKNSEEILNESLLKISELLKEQVNILQKHNLTEMSVHNRVLKAKSI